MHDLLSEHWYDWPLPISWARSESVTLDDGSIFQAFSFVQPEHQVGNGGQVVKAGADGFVRSVPLDFLRGRCADGIVARAHRHPGREQLVGFTPAEFGWAFTR